MTTDTQEQPETELVTSQQAADAVKRMLRANGQVLDFAAGNVLSGLREQEAAQNAVNALPPTPATPLPVYFSIDGGQSGFIIPAHVEGEALAAIPLAAALEMIDELAQSAEACPHTASREANRNQLLSGYGPDLAELLCQGIDEVMEAQSRGFKRLKDYDGERFAPLTSDKIDEPYYETCAAEAEHATPATEFSFYNVIEAAAELIEIRDRAAKAARQGNLEAVQKALAEPIAGING